MIGQLLHALATLFSVIVLMLWSVGAMSDFVHEQGPDPLVEKVILFGGWAAVAWLALT